MKIVLMRHGKPVLSPTRWVYPMEMAAWIEGYDRADMAHGQPPADSRAQAASAAVIVSSATRRALSSAQALGRSPDVVDALFGEAGLPVAPMRGPRLPPSVWAAVFRTLWFFGWAWDAEPLTAARARAKAAAATLVALSVQGPVLLVGHGIMNGLIATELRALGWHGARPGGRHWNATAYAP